MVVASSRASYAIPVATGSSSTCCTRWYVYHIAIFITIIGMVHSNSPWCTYMYSRTRTRTYLGTMGVIIVERCLVRGSHACQYRTRWHGVGPKRQVLKIS
jgi:hypothetical protein